MCGSFATRSIADIAAIGIRGRIETHISKPRIATTQIESRSADFQSAGQSRPYVLRRLPF